MTCQNSYCYGNDAMMEFISILHNNGVRDKTLACQELDRFLVGALLLRFFGNTNKETYDGIQAILHEVQNIKQSVPGATL